MKIVCLIPFVVGLIGFDKCQKESPATWKYGPEYTFNIKVNTTLLYTKSSNDEYSNLTIIIKCRPFSSTNINDYDDSLQCHVHDAQKQNHDIIQSTKLPIIHSDRPTILFNIVNQTFEILFDKNGVKDLRVDIPITNWRLNVLRLIVNQFNYGLYESEKNTFEKRENSTSGNCHTKIDVTKKVEFLSEKWISSCGEKIHIEMLAYGNKYPIVLVNKTRDVNKCSKYSTYLFGDEKDKIGYDIKMESSLSGLAIAHQSFSSYTINKGIMTYKNVQKTSPTLEHIDLRLVSIDPAIREIKRLEKPGVTSLFIDDTITKVTTPKTVL